MRCLITGLHNNIQNGGIILSYNHPTISNRVKIETYLELDYSIRKIAHLLNRQPSTISRELKRYANYQADKAQLRYCENKTNCGVKSKCTPEVKRFVQEQLGILG